jgi:hypothetical protein
LVVEVLDVEVDGGGVSRRFIRLLTFSVGDLERNLVLGARSVLKDAG